MESAPSARNVTDKTVFNFSEFGVR